MGAHPQLLWLGSCWLLRTWESPGSGQLEPRGPLSEEAEDWASQEKPRSGGSGVTVGSVFVPKASLLPQLQAKGPELRTAPMAKPTEPDGGGGRCWPSAL